MTPTEIARRLGLATPTVTKTTARMEAVGLMVRVPDGSDRRLVRIRLTKRGRDLQKAVDAAIRRVSSRALRGRSKADRAELVRLLGAVRRTLTVD